MSTGQPTLEIRRNGALAALIGGSASLVAILYLARALGGGSALDWLLFLGLGLLGAAHVSSALDARTPLLVADDHGVRVRLGRSWRGVPWNEVDHVEHLPRTAPWRDGRLVLAVDDEETVLHGLDRAGRRQVAISRRLYGAPLALPLALTTRVVGADGDLTGTLVELVGDPERVLEPVVEAVWDDEATWDDHDGDRAAEDLAEDLVEDLAEDRLEDRAGDSSEHTWTESWSDGPVAEPAGDVSSRPHPVVPDLRPALARGIGYVAEMFRGRPADPDIEADIDAGIDADPDIDAGDDARSGPAPVVASPTPLPLRDPVGAARVEVRFEGAAALQVDPSARDHETAARLPEVEVLRRDPDETQLFDQVVVDQVVVDEGVEDAHEVDDVDDVDAVEPGPDPVIGPELAAARVRLGLGVDQLAERTRIRPHVIESIEVDDFGPCGGDFYARGHLRTLARVLGVDAAPLLATYDEVYADAPIDARRVFEAELAVGADGPIRSTRGGPNWSVLVAAVMTLVLAWSIARLLTDSPVHLKATPVLNGSPSGQTTLGAPVPVLLDAAKGGAHVVVKDGAGKVAFTGDLAYGERKTLKVAPPVQVQSSDGALKVTVDRQARGPLGASGQPAQDTFAASR